MPVIGFEICEISSMLRKKIKKDFVWICETSGRELSIKSTFKSLAGCKQWAQARILNRSTLNDSYK